MPVIYTLVLLNQLNEIIKFRYSLLGKNHEYPRSSYLSVKSSRYSWLYHGSCIQEFCAKCCSQRHIGMYWWEETCLQRGMCVPDSNSHQISILLLNDLDLSFRSTVYLDNIDKLTNIRGVFRLKIIFTLEKFYVIDIDQINALLANSSFLPLYINEEECTISRKKYDLVISSWWWNDIFIWTLEKCPIMCAWIRC